jgi:hypothetical protein
VKTPIRVNVSEPDTVNPYDLRSLVRSVINSPGGLITTSFEHCIMIGIALEVRVAPPDAPTLNFTSKFPTVCLAIVIYLHGAVLSPEAGHSGSGYVIQAGGAVNESSL